MKASCILPLTAALTATLLTGCDNGGTAPQSQAEIRDEKKQSPLEKATGPPVSRKPTDAQSDQQLADETRFQLISQLVAIIGKPGSEVKEEHWREFKSLHWLPSYDAVIPLVENMSDVKDVIGAENPKRSLTSQVLGGSFEETKKAEKDALLACHSMAMLIASGGGTSLPAALNDRKDDPKITKGDLILFELFQDGFQNGVRKGVLSAEAMDDWRSLTKSRNLIVRSLALKTFKQVSSEPGQWLEFYGGYLDEQDPVILKEVVDSLVESGNSDAVNILANLKSRSIGRLTPQEVDKLDRSIKFLESSTSRKR